jgi:hypothetical protein
MIDIERLHRVDDAPRMARLQSRQIRRPVGGEMKFSPRHFLQ